MSAFMSSQDAFNAVVSYAMRRGTPQHCGDTPADVVQRIWNNARVNYNTTCTVDPSDWKSPANAMFLWLIDANQKSLMARYDDGAEMAAEADDYQVEQLPIVDYWMQTQQTGNLVGILKGIEYQCCEFTDWTQHPAYLLLEQCRSWLLSDMERQHCGSDFSNWASFTAPEDPREVAMRETLASNRK